jgi:phosphatidylserine decarboxylase
METGIGRVMVVQLAGLIARTIVPFKEIGDDLKQGEPMGLIKFGSRVDLWIPTSTTLRIKEGEKIKIGEIIATY